MASNPSRAKRSISANAAQGLSVRLRRSARWALVSGAAATGTLSWLKGGSSCVETKRPGTGPGLLGTRMARAALVGEDLGTGLTSKRLSAHAPRSSDILSGRPTPRHEGMRMVDNVYDLAVIGSGPAGQKAAGPLPITARS